MGICLLLVLVFSPVCIVKSSEDIYPLQDVLNVPTKADNGESEPNETNLDKTGLQDDSDVESLRRELRDMKRDLQLLSRQQSALQTDVTSMDARAPRDFIWYDDEWILAFRGTHGIGQTIYGAWTNKGHHDDDPYIRSTMPCGCTTVNGSLPCDRHYRSRLLDMWPSASIDQVKVVLYEKGVEKQHVTFTGTGSDYLSWFTNHRLIESSWVDLHSASKFVTFSIPGAHKRRFYIEANHGGCEKDVGWLTMKDAIEVACKWDTIQHVPTFLYSPSSYNLKWSGNGTRRADVMAVLVKLRHDTPSPLKCN